MNKIKINLHVDNIKKFVSITNKYKSDIDVISDRTTLDAKSILGLYSLDLSQDIYVCIITNNTEEYMQFELEMKEFM